MDAATINEIAEAFPEDAHVQHLVERWRDIVKPGSYRKSGNRWRRYHEPKFLRQERKRIEKNSTLLFEAKTRQTELFHSSSRRNHRKNQTMTTSIGNNRLNKRFRSTNKQTTDHPNKPHH